MAKIYFRYGTMGSSKTADAIIVWHNYKTKYKEALLVKPQIDQRDGDKVIKSRAGLSAPCEYFENITMDMVKGYSAVIVDEAQFLSKEQIDFLIEVADVEDIPVICYGLRTDFKGELFTGSKYLFEVADSLEELKTICWCGRKALYNARIDDEGRILRNGPVLELGGNERYVALCRKHYHLGKAPRRTDK